MSRSSERVGAWIIRFSEIQWQPLRWITIGCVLFVLAGVLLPVGSGPGMTRERTQATNDVAILQTSLRAYRSDYGSLPTGSQGAIIRALFGDNPRKIIYLELRPKQLNAAGEFIDPWGSPYRIDLSDPDQPRIHSPGKNKRDELDAPGSDDIRSWRL